MGEYVPKVGDRIRWVLPPYMRHETGKVKSSWPDLKEGYATLDRPGQCTGCSNCDGCGSALKRGARFRYDEVERLPARRPVSAKRETP